MSYHCCVGCLYPIYTVISLEEPAEYVCLVKACKSFKVSVPQSGTFINVGEDLPDFPLDLESDYPAAGLEDDIAQTLQEQSAQQEPTAASEPTRASLAKQRRISAAKARAARRRALLPTAEEPMSEQVGEDGPDPVEKAKAFVRRSITQRRQEAETAGKVKRPLNGFMLYRMAYLPAVKEMHKLYNPGEVSVYLGQSWAIEPGSVRDRFAELAAEEIEIHRLAFPEYIYHPRRARVAQESDSE